MADSFRRDLAVGLISFLATVAWIVFQEGVQGATADLPDALGRLFFVLLTCWVPAGITILAVGSFCGRFPGLVPAAIATVPAGVIAGFLLATPVADILNAHAANATIIAAAIIVPDYPNTISKTAIPVRQDGRQECVIYRTTDDPSVVTAFYQSAFKAKNWTISYSTPTFLRVKTHQSSDWTGGDVTVALDQEPLDLLGAPPLSGTDYAIKVCTTSFRALASNTGSADGPSQ
jgi:hypothetical protein